MATIVWRCDTCKGISVSRMGFFPCVGCNQEACECCLDRFAHCKKCGEGKTDEELRLAANAAGYDF